MRVPPGPVCFDDLIMGKRCHEPFLETGAFVVRRKDGVAAYQLAVVVDDHLMRISHVLRGADLLASTSRQVLLYRALGWEPPAWAHVPLMLGPDGARLAKRHGAVSLRELRERGVAPEAIVGWLAWSCGLVERPVDVDPRGLVGGFDLERLPKIPTVVEKLPF
jgi:glutamyl-tRNA synthetase